ncbi:hypothetical protein H6P81_003435 [Aristolochia fimbriata]|uniref:F-box/LRR-repeat protein 15/At3g58940/PEG3-like LRR domain-containing protein n=1 Tax=Aristolochia fimbriata TaxID=158543 RepID=A0AAV7FGM5_ARIFI|nr:hypothetical protein H6P81_003435 [Aristolochia fimbriata]
MRDRETQTESGTLFVVTGSMTKNLQEMEEDVRTSILSWKWRHVWASIPVPQFDDASLPACSENRQLQKRQKKKEGFTNRVGLISIVDLVLLLHNGPIEKFNISVDVEDRSLVVDKWVLSLAGRGVKDLFLDFKKMEDLYIVPSCLFLCKLLRKLSLHCCVLKPPPKFKGLCKLKALNLKDTTFTKETIESLISSCSLLEDLKLKFDYWLERVTVCAPRLILLNLWGDFGDLSVVNATSLAFVEINDVHFTVFCTEKDTRDFSKSLDHLKCLKFNLNFFDSKECQVALCLFKSSPNLEEVEIIGDYTGESGTFYMKNSFGKSIISKTACLITSRDDTLAPVLVVMNSLLLFPRASAVAKVSCPYEGMSPS